MGVRGLVLVAGEEPLILDLLIVLLDAFRYEVMAVSSEMDLPDELQPALVLLDLDTVTSEGSRWIRRLRDGLRVGVPVIVLTVEDDVRRLALKFDAQAWLPKPFDIDSLLQAVQRLSPPRF